VDVARRGEGALPGAGAAGGGVGGFAGAALDGKKAPEHLHDKITGKINLPSKNFILIGGCCNGNLGDSGDYSISGASEAASGDLPYIQYAACIKVANPDGSAISAGVLTQKEKINKKRE